MEHAKARTLTGILLVAALLGAAVGLAAAQSQQACAYTYLKTESPYIFNRGWIEADSTGYMEFIGSDPHGDKQWMPSFNMPGGWNGWVSSYRFAVWSTAGGQDDISWYTVGRGSWTRGGATMGHGGVSESGDIWRNGTGTGCLATYGYGWGGKCASAHGGLDAEMNAHVYIAAGWPEAGQTSQYYGSVNFWPRVKVQYDANGGTAAPSAHYKYIGNTANISSAKPTRTGYTFEGWSTKKTGPVNISGGQKIGYEDWNLKRCTDMPTSWGGGGYGYPTNFVSAEYVGIPSPSGTNIITLYAQWKPITYKVVYEGNGATSGSTASSSHVYGAAKALTPNGFKRAYALSCDACGGSAGTVSLSCVWPWKSWNDRVDGTGAAYGDGASVKNLRSLAGTAILYAQWERGLVTLPHPGSKPDCVFKGWYTEPSGGSFAGSVGDAVTIDRDATYYARWERLAPVSYCVDGDPAPVFSETAEAETPYAVNARATAAAEKPDCAGFDGWYADAACTKAYVDGTPVPTGGLTLYGRNKVELAYGLADQTAKLFADHACYADEAQSGSLTPDSVLPPAQTLYYGDRVAVARGRSIWYDEHGRMREAVCDLGAYPTPAAEGIAARSMKLTCNTTAYLRWRVPEYDGIELS